MGKVKLRENSDITMRRRHVERRPRLNKEVRVEEARKRSRLVKKIWELCHGCSVSEKGTQPDKCGAPGKKTVAGTVRRKNDPRRKRPCSRFLMTGKNKNVHIRKVK